MTSGLAYRFKTRSQNALGYSEFSDNFQVGLGPLPSKPVAPTKSSDESLSSPSSLFMEWPALQSETLLVRKYNLYMDDGYGVTYTKIFEDDCLEFLIVDLTPGIAYSFYVTATNLNGEGEASDITYLKSCISPQNLEAPYLVMTTELTVMLRWL
jgi:hypothetical protein